MDTSYPGFNKRSPGHPRKRKENEPFPADDEQPTEGDETNKRQVNYD